MVDISRRSSSATSSILLKVNLNQVTTMVGYLPPSAAKAHAVDAKAEGETKA